MFIEQELRGNKIDWSYENMLKCYLRILFSEIIFITVLLVFQFATYKDSLLRDGM
jgi:magnesium-transporting ATPase (P-type)